MAQNFLSSSSVPSFGDSFLTKGFKPRVKSFGERFVDDISSLSLKQGLGAPFTAPLTATAGIAKGLSFGLIDPTEKFQKALGEFALPDTLTSSLEVAGDLGGSFLPFVGAGAVAGKVFKGLSFGAKLARGATTFGAPEVARQALTGELDAPAAFRSVVTGAAFGVPISGTIGSRLALGGGTAAANLALGGEPTEAGIQGLFAGLFGSSGGPKQKAVQKVVDQVNPKLPPLPTKPGIKGEQLGLGFKESSGSRQIKTPPVPPPTQVQRLKTAARGNKQGENLAGAIEIRAKALPEARLTSDLLGAMEQFGAESKQAQIARLVLAQKRGGFVPPGAPVKQRLLPPVRGVELVEQGVNPMDTRLDFAKLLTEMRAQGGPVGKTRSAELQRLGLQVQEELAFAKANGQQVSPGKIKDFKAEQERLLASPKIEWKSEQHALDVGAQELGQMVDRNAITRFAELPPGHYMSLPEGAKKRLQKMAKDRLVVLDEVDAAAQPFVNQLERQPKGLKEFYQESSDAGLTLTPTRGTAQVTSGKLPTILTQFDRNRRISFSLGKSGRRSVKFESQADQSLWLIGSKIKNNKLDAAINLIDNFSTRSGIPKQEVQRLAIEARQGTLKVARGVGKGETATVPAGSFFKPPSAAGFELKYSGATVKNFKSVKEGREWLTKLEAGSIQPANIHELRALAYPRGIIIENNGRNVNVINQLTGETVADVSSMKQATGLVRQSPNVAATAREVAPSAGEFPPLSGSGGIGGIHTEQIPSLCPMDLDQTSNSLADTLRASIAKEST